MRVCHHQAGLSKYLDRAEQLLYSDRHKGIPHFEKHFKCGQANCIIHIIKNIRTKLRKTPGARVGFAKEQVFDIQKADTLTEFNKVMARLRVNYPEAAEYLSQVDADKTFTYALIKGGYSNHGHMTSNLVEIVNAVLKEARTLTPYFLNDHLFTWIARLLAERQAIVMQLEKHDEWLYTPYAEDKIAQQELYAGEEDLDHTPLGSNHHLVKHRRQVAGEWLETRHIVNLEDSTCDCSFFRCNKLPCMHAIVVVDSFPDSRRDTPSKMLQFRDRWVRVRVS